MALVIETGSGAANSQSYVSVADFLEWAASRNHSVPADQAESMLLDAMDYLEQFSSDSTPAYKGQKKSATQALQWPRVGVIIDKFAFPVDQIPKQLIAAQMQLAIESMEFDLMPSTDGFAVAKEKVDVIEIEYATGGRLSGATEAADVAPTFPRVDAHLKHLFVNVGMKLRTVRI